MNICELEGLDQTKCFVDISSNGEIVDSYLGQEIYWSKITIIFISGTRNLLIKNHNYLFLGQEIYWSKELKRVLMSTNASSTSHA